MGLILFHYALISMACTTMSPNGARLLYDRVAVYVVANSTCTDAGVDGEQLLRLTQSSIDQFWNKISSSRLRFYIAGYWNQDVVRFETGELCVPDVNCTNSTVPITNHVIISCNDNTDNFSATTYAKTSIVIESDFITGANVLLNNTAGSVFGNLSEKQKLWVIAHELGHAAGLGHSKSAANLMYFTLTPDRVALGEEDYWGMTYLYPQNHDGCGLIGSTTKNSDKTEGSFFQIKNFFFNVLIGFWIFITIIILQKVFLKRFKIIL
jgi:hypothetical protein